MICHGCRHDGVGVGHSICKYCDVFLCLIGQCGNDPNGHLMADYAGGEPDAVACDACGDLVCWNCADDSLVMPYCQKCNRTICRDCDQIFEEHFTNCGDCGGLWCNGCAPRSITCVGSDRMTPANADGCFKTLCWTCEHKSGASFTFCDGCSGATVWCKDCVPGSIVYCTGEDCASADKDGDTDTSLEGCYDAFCKECAWDEDTPHCIECPVCDGTWCAACSPATDGERVTCPRCAAIATRV